MARLSEGQLDYIACMINLLESTSYASSKTGVGGWERKGTERSGIGCMHIPSGIRLTVSQAREHVPVSDCRKSRFSEQA
jgi:hypothetical protein